MAEVNWNDDKSVVLSVFPTAFENKHLDVCIINALDEEHFLGITWTGVRNKNPHVIAYERTHNPASQAVAEPQEARDNAIPEWTEPTDPNAPKPMHVGCSGPCCMPELYASGIKGGGAVPVAAGTASGEWYEGMADRDSKGPVAVGQNGEDGDAPHDQVSRMYCDSCGTTHAGACDDELAKDEDPEPWSTHENVRKASRGEPHLYIPGRSSCFCGENFGHETHTDAPTPPAPTVEGEDTAFKAWWREDHMHITTVVSEEAAAYIWRQSRRAARPANASASEDGAGQNQRLMDLVRHERSELLRERLISVEEWTALASDEKSGMRVARLESYDNLRSELAKALAGIASANERADLLQVERDNLSAWKREAMAAAVEDRDWREKWNTFAGRLGYLGIHYLEAACKTAERCIEAEQLLFTDEEVFTSFQAAKVLGVSRQHLVHLIGRNLIPFHWVGTHRRLYRRDVLAYKAVREKSGESA